LPSKASDERSEEDRSAGVDERSEEDQSAGDDERKNVVPTSERD
jgi:hypothetical protein